MNGAAPGDATEAAPAPDAPPGTAGPDGAWAYASLTLSQPGWPGTRKAEWVAATAGSEQFRISSLLAAMDRLGDEGWELVTFAPEWGDRSAGFYFKRMRPPRR